MHTVMSPDGTTIAYDRTGSGEPLILIGGAFSYRRYPGQVKLAGPGHVRYREGQRRLAPARLGGRRCRAAALPDARLLERRGLGHAKKLTPTVAAAALTEFLTDPGSGAATPDPGRITQ